ncbi:hypothetical protein [Candidatus Venteria ishoeyi]|uniref:Uncharacterized protein n=1 Tax=Candidatus Venteria ishoeyi TaxID=1899563 RepID=A0A1H6FDI8_9GAMM|nr:hypothetical protein [Candidatus Venteria ishoeyi]MDM8545342.1 hypothetical protein [Candidatus Venteria ishoeyi]SEH07226.1 Uncharacterised protein [Candidatus Venteria ishoeyi]
MHKKLSIKRHEQRQSKARSAQKISDWLLILLLVILYALPLRVSAESTCLTLQEEHQQLRLENQQLHQELKVAQQMIESMKKHLDQLIKIQQQVLTELADELDTGHITDFQ